MKRNWSTDELIEHWTLTPTERQMVERAETASNQLGFAVLLKWFQSEGRFLARKQDVPSAVVQFLARQVAVNPEAFQGYAWQGSTIERGRAKIRQALGFREATVQDAELLTTWLLEAVVGEQRNEDALRTTGYRWLI